MQILSECNLSEVVVEILNGKTLVFPTETSYGLGCDATNQSAVDRIFRIKGRKSDKPLLVVVPTIEMAKKYLKWTSTLEKLSANYWPGALTIVGEAYGGALARGVVAADGTVAVRVSSFPLLKSITEKIGRPLVATSANLSDTGEIYDAEKIHQTFKSQSEQPDLILNHGILPKHSPTTIIRVNGDEIEILRQGELKVKI